MKQQIKESLSGWMNECTDGWVSYFFAELLLHSSLRHLLSQLLLEQPLLWATSSDPLLLWAASPTYSVALASLLSAQLLQCIYQPPAAIPHSVALWSIGSFRTAATIRLATSSCKPAKQDRRTKSTNVRAALTMNDSAPLRLFCFFAILFWK